VEDYPDFRDKSESFRHSLTAVIIIPRSVLTALVSQFDAYIGHLLRALFLARPELVNTFDAALSFREVVDLGSIDEAREYIIEREIDKIIRLSHIDQIKWFEKTLKIQFTELYDSIPQFVELMERRNLFVHADGVVSRHYLRVCVKHGIDASDSKQGQKLFVEPSYFLMVARILLEVGVLLGHQVWRRVLKTDIGASDDQLGDITFMLIRRGKYKAASRMLEFILKDMPKPATEKTRLIHIINLSNAYRLMGQKEKSFAVLQREDWSAKSYEYQLGHAVLKQEFERAAELMIKIGKASYPGKQHYRDWPLFTEFRESQEFLTAFEQVFGEKFAFSQKSVDVSEQEKEEVAANLSEPDAAATTTPAP
jgi:hypothetical protein